jgi:hypothetical protein
VNRIPALYDFEDKMLFGPSPSQEIERISLPEHSFGNINIA